MYHETRNRSSKRSPSVLATLRGLVPHRTTSFTEALRVAELQANRLRELTDAEDPALPEDVVLGLPRIEVVRRRLPTSGMSFWESGRWTIALNSRESEARQRFTLLHELKHIIDHGQIDRLYAGSGSTKPEQQAEQAADYFAGCALMPKRLLKRAWGAGTQDVNALAQLFEVSARAVEVRLDQTALIEPIGRCAPPASVRSRLPGRYFRAASLRFGGAVA